MMLRKYRLVTLLSLLFVVINTFGYYSLDEVREVYKTTGSLSSFSNDVGEINENETSLEEKKKEVLNSYNKIVQSYYDFFEGIQKEIVVSLCSDLERTAEGLEPSIYSIKDKITNANINDAKKDDYFHKVDSIESELHEVVNNTSDLVFILKQLKQVESFEKKLKTREYYQEALESATTLKDIENVAEQVAELDKTLSELVPYIHAFVDEWDKFIQNKLKDISEYLRKMNEDSALQTVSGKCGENLTWAYDVDTQTLTISGTGDMVNYLSEIGAPWLPYKDRILRVIINEGVTGIGNYAFYNCSNLTSVISKIVNPFKISNSVFSNIGSNAILTVPSGTKSKYQATNYWNKFTNIVEESASDASDSEGWKLIDDNFDKSIPIKKIRVKNVKSTSASYCCIFFSTKANDNTTEDTNYNINFYNRTIGDNRSQGSGVQISSCTNVGDNWYEYEFKQTVYFSHYQSNSPRDQVLAFVSNSSDTSSPKRTIHVATAGTLPNLISESEKYTIEELTLTGELNGTDFRLLRDMAGNNYLGQDTEGKLKVLDMSEVTIVYGGEHYVATNSLPDWSGQFRYTVWKSDEMPRHVFHGCKLKEVHMPNTLKSILDGAFARCKELTSVIIHNNVTSIENDVFNGCTGLTSITIPNSVTSMGSSVFYGCSGLTSISIPNSVTSIGSSVFYGCGSLTSVSIPNSVSSIETNSFRDCSNLSTITIPNSVTSIGDWAFYQCNNLTSITIPNSVTSIGNSVFYGCNSLASIKVESGNTSYDSRNGCNAIIETATNTLIVGCMNTTIPNDILSIGSHAFRGCTGIKSMIIPSKVTYIGDYAFRDCSNLSSIEIPKSVTSIGNGAFCYCSSLSSITLPRDMTSIGSSAFYRCKNMYSILSEIIEPFEIEESVFWNIGSNATLTVPKGTKSKYQATNYWNKFTNIVEANEGSPTTEVTFTSNQITYRGIVSSRTAEVKSVNAGVTDLEIPSSVSYDGTTYQVTSIADDALSNRTFNYVSLPSTVKSISSNTFYNSKLGALIWNASASLSQSVFSNMGMPINCNFLLYVNSASYAPSNVKNVVINSSAQTILLSDDGGDFYCPKAFTAQSISYTHNYSMTTGGSGKGWETLALPFDVQKIEHKTKGTLTPFALYDTNSSSQRPFWLYELGSNGFRRSEGIKANTPYIISMPNSTSYDSEYILTGDVTFSASSVQVRATSSATTAVSGSKRFVPAFSTVAKGSSVYALNVSNQKVSNSSSYDSGSRFISNLRSVYPFEAYMTTSSSGARMLNIGIEFEDDATDIDIIPSANREQGVVKVYSLNGTLVLQTDRESLQKQWEPLPAGIYIVNGKKMVK